MFEEPTVDITDMRFDFAHMFTFKIVTKTVITIFEMFKI